MMLSAAATLAILAALAFVAGRAVAVNVEELQVESDMYRILLEGAEGADHFHPGKKKGQAALRPAFVEALKTNAGVAPFSQCGGDRERLVPTTFMTRTSVPHIDQYSAGAPLPPDEIVAFFTLNTNEDAHFDVDEVCVPIEANRLISFNGGRSIHHTVINSGIVNYLGPIHMNSMTSVGSSCSVSTNGFCGCSQAVGQLRTQDVCESNAAVCEAAACGCTINECGSCTDFFESLSINERQGCSSCAAAIEAVTESSSCAETPPSEICDAALCPPTSPPTAVCDATCTQLEHCFTSTSFFAESSKGPKSSKSKKSKSNCETKDALEATCNALKGFEGLCECGGAD